MKTQCDCGCQGVADGMDCINPGGFVGVAEQLELPFDETPPQREPATTLRGKDWEEFSEVVLDHIEDYTISQYGDRPGDELEDWAVEECVRTIRKYCTRFDHNARGNHERSRDMLKIAHFAQVAWHKLYGVG